jgi:hypothetical protein
MNNSGKLLLKWAARVVGAVVIGIIYLQWKQIAETYELENGVMGTYRPITLGLAYYLLWIFAGKIDQPAEGSQGLSVPQIALFALIVCVAIAAGFFAAQFAYVEAVDRSASVVVAKSVGFVAFMAAAGAVIGGLNRVAGPHRI